MRNKLKEKRKLVENEKIVAPVLLLFLIFISYALLIPWMGFYWDDLPFVWFRHFFGPSEFITAFQAYRPLLGYFFAATTAIFGENPLTWQILGLVVRFLLGLEVWFLLRQVWPRQRQSVLWASMLFTVYPAYQQQWVAFTHINQELLPFLFLLASFILTTWSMRHGRSTAFLTIFSLVFQAVALFSTEYFFGLEILRFLFIIALLEDLSPDRKVLMRRSFLVWLPYLVVWAVSAAGIYAFHRSAVYASYQIEAPASLSFVGLLNELLNTLSLSAFTVWLSAFDLFAVIDGSMTQIIAFVLMFVVTAVVFLVMHRNGQPVDLVKEDDRFGRWAVVIGIVGIFAGRLPSWAVGLPLMIVFDYDRFFVSIMLGASLLTMGLADLLLRNGRGKMILLSILIGASAAGQFFTANTFRRDWANQRDFFWQVAWRMPALQPGTALLTSDLPLKFASDIQLTAPLNWMYVPGLDQLNLPYAMLHLKTRFTLPEIRAGQPITLPYRTASFHGNMSKVVVIYKEADGCLRVLDPVYNNAATVPGANPYLVSAIPLSKPELIQTQAPSPQMNEMLFGREPSHGWCYFYEKAEISRLNGEWEEVANLYREAQMNELAPALPVEYLPFIEAFAQTGKDEMAFKLTERVIKEQKLMCPALLSLWERNSETEEMPVEIINILQKGCASSHFDLQTTAQ